MRKNGHFLAVCLILAIAAVSVGSFAAANSLAYVLELRFSDSYDSEDEGLVNSLTAYCVLSSAGGDHLYRVTSDGAAEPDKAILQAALVLAATYTDDGVQLSQNSDGCGQLIVQLKYQNILDELHISTDWIPIDPYNLFIGRVAVEYSNHVGMFVWDRAGVHPMRRGSVEWGRWILLPDTPPHSFGTADFGTWAYSAGVRNDIHLDPKNDIQGLDGFAIQACSWGDVTIHRVWVYVFFKVATH